MYARISQLNNLPIISLQTAEAVGFTRSPILEPATLEIVAFNCGALNRSRHPLILMTADIRQLAPDCIVIDTEEELTEPGDVVRLQPLIKKSYSPIGKSVVTDASRRLGSVEDYSINLESNRVQKLFVRQSILQAWIGTNLVIDRTQIMDVTPSQIIVRDTTVKNPLIPADPVPGTQP
jgi:sporulation protein YlmC with PRC-barrel domain